MTLTGHAAVTSDRPPAAPGAIPVSCRGLVYIYRLEGYDVVALSGVDLDLAAGESVALLGPSGSGKSTLLAVMAGLLPPAAGKVIVGDHDVARASAGELQYMRAKDVGVVLQGAARNLLPYLTAEQNVRFAQRGAPAAVRRQQPSARDVLSLVGLAGRGRSRQRPDRLAPGERQRLALAVALANKPGLLLADEPTSQLDSRSRDEVLAALEAVRRAGTTVVVVTHDPAVGAQMGRTVTIRDGRVGAEGHRGEDYSVVARDGSIHLPADVLRAFVPGTLVRVWLESDGSARLMAAGASASGAATAPTTGGVAPCATGVASAPVTSMEQAPPDFTPAHGRTSEYQAVDYTAGAPPYQPHEPYPAPEPYTTHDTTGGHW